MTPQQTRHILRTHRADGRYTANDPLFAEALVEVSQNPELAVWLAREHALDDVIGRKIEQVQPPAGLRETILLGAHASGMKRRRRLQFFAWGVAAVLVLALLLVALMRIDPTPEGGALTPETFGRLAIADFTSARLHSHEYPAPMAAVQSALSAGIVPLSDEIEITPEILRAANCASVDLNGHASYEVCFQRGGVWYHLYVAEVDGITSGATGSSEPVLLEQTGLVAATWSKGAFVYTVITDGGVEALRRVV